MVPLSTGRATVMPGDVLDPVVMIMVRGGRRCRPATREHALDPRQK
jgi:hypothetical protein